ncbi:MAG: glycosyltransferase [Candidatus ainarchaeum sp.]|nr:glycosyltransferase [Candidatus ainarchaeum sp.]
MKASVIIPAFNAEKAIKQCLEALEKQTTGNFEVIVVDDGSTDKTPELAKKFRGIRLLQQKNSGPAAARNLGAKNAKGEIIIFTDSDCIAEKNFLEEMLAPFADKKIAGVQGKYKSRQKELAARLTQLEIEQRHEKMAKQESIDFMGSYAAAYRKKVFEEMKGFDTSYPMASGEDTDLSFRISKAGHKMVFSEKAVVWHTHPASFLKYLRIKFYRAFWRTKLYGKHKDKIVNDSYTSLMIKIQLAVSYFFIASVIVAGFNSDALKFSAISIIVFFITTIPFAAWAFGRDKTIGIVFPGIAFCRTISFGIGLIAGTIRQVRNSI